MNSLIEKLEELSEEARYHSATHQGFSDMSEYYLGYAEGITEAIELIKMHNNDARIAELMMKLREM